MLKLQLHMIFAMELRREKNLKALGRWVADLCGKVLKRARHAIFVNHHKNYIRWKTETLTLEAYHNQQKLLRCDLSCGCYSG